MDNLLSFGDVHLKEKMQYALDFIFPSAASHYRCSYPADPLQKQYLNAMTSYTEIMTQ